MKKQYKVWLILESDENDNIEQMQTNLVANFNSVDDAMNLYQGMADIGEAIRLLHNRDVRD